MDENDLRDAMHSLTTLDTPPPMASSAVLAAGRESVRRRYAMAGAGTAAALAVAVGWGLGPGSALFAGDGATQAAGPGMQPAAAPSPSATAIPMPGFSVPPRIAGPPPNPNDTAPVWPLDGDGKPQTDATSKSGHRFEQGVKLRDQLLAVVPDGYDTPDGELLRYHQAAVEGDHTGSTWRYSAQVAIAKNGGTGGLAAEIYTTGNDRLTEPCALAAQYRQVAGDCQVITVGGAEVGVSTVPGGDQWAAYRHTDGTVVYVAQSRRVNEVMLPGTPGLTELPLTTGALAALAADARFHLA